MTRPAAHGTASSLVVVVVEDVGRVSRSLRPAWHRVPPGDRGARLSRRPSSCPAIIPSEMGLRWSEVARSVVTKSAWPSPLTSPTARPAW
jgi:hypothetical protein